MTAHLLEVCKCFQKMKIKFQQIESNDLKIWIVNLIFKFVTICLKNTINLENWVDTNLIDFEGNLMYQIWKFERFSNLNLKDLKDHQI